MDHARFAGPGAKRRLRLKNYDMGATNEDIEGGRPKCPDQARQPNQLTASDLLQTCNVTSDPRRNSIGDCYFAQPAFPTRNK